MKGCSKFRFVRCTDILPGLALKDARPRVEDTVVVVPVSTNPEAPAVWAILLRLGVLVRGRKIDAGTRLQEIAHGRLLLRHRQADCIVDAQRFEGFSEIDGAALDVSAEQRAEKALAH